MRWCDLAGSPKKCLMRVPSVGLRFNAKVVKTQLALTCWAERPWRGVRLWLLFDQYGLFVDC